MPTHNKVKFLGNPCYNIYAQYRLSTEFNPIHDFPSRKQYFLLSLVHQIFSN